MDSATAINTLKKYPWYLFYHYFALLDYRKRTDLLLSNALHNQAEQKYLAMIRQRPEIFQLAPLHDIASFLGITPQSLSRLRKTLTHKEV
jgi:DNA-binding MarR family transcriptional regulator